MLPTARGFRGNSPMQQSSGDRLDGHVQLAARAAKLLGLVLQALLGDYADHLEALGRRSHADVRSIIKLHVLEPWPQVASLPANQVTGEQIADMMRRVVELGKDRTANKLRSYVRAAYQTAKAARSKASIPPIPRDESVPVVHAWDVLDRKSVV